jgi:hypothetical protein
VDDALGGVNRFNSVADVVDSFLSGRERLTAAAALAAAAAAPVAPVTGHRD